MSKGIGPAELQESELSWSILSSLFLKKNKLLDRNISSVRQEKDRKRKEKRNEKEDIYDLTIINQ